MAPPLTRDRIVDEALVLARGGGLDALTLRPLAARLGVGAPALYRHVASRGALVSLMVERLIAAREPLPPGLPWDDALRGAAAAIWEIYAPYPGLALEALAGDASSERTRADAQRLVSRLRADGFAAENAERAVVVFARWALAFIGAIERRPERYAELPDRPPEDPRALYDDGVELLIAGLAVRRRG